MLRSRNLLSLNWLLCMVILLFSLTAGCVRWESRKGVANKWRDKSLPEFEVGQTTQGEVVNNLGPPSQVISVGDQVVFYYMLEKQEGKGGICIVYNRIDEDTTYDRAVFFFDEEGVLSEYAYSPEKVSYGKKP